MKGELSYSESLLEQFVRYCDEGWMPDEAYTITDFAVQFDIDIRLSRYYLMKLVDTGRLCQIKLGRSTYYTLRYWRRIFIELLGVKVL